MNWSNYFKSLEEMYRIKIDSTLRSAIKNNFTEDCNIFTEQDMYEQTRKIVQTYQYSKINNKYKHIN